MSQFDTTDKSYDGDEFTPTEKAEFRSNWDIGEADDEDLEKVDGKYKQKDRSSSGNQKGYKIIRQNFDFQNIPAGYDNSIWEIRYEHDLLTNTVLIPSGVELVNNGGVFKNGILQGDDTLYNSVGSQLFENIDFAGTFKNYEIFSGDFDKTSLFNFINTIQTPLHIRLKEGQFGYDTSVLLPTNSILEGSGIGKTIIKKNDNSDLNRAVVGNKVGAANIKIKRLSINGNSDNQTVPPNSTRNSGIQLIACSDSIIEEVEVYKCSYSDELYDGGAGAISLGESSNNCVIRDCIVRNNEFSGIIAKGSSSVRIINNRIFENRISGIDTNSFSPFAVISDNEVYDNGHNFNQISCNSRSQTVTKNRVYRSNLVVNGDFNVDLSGWTDVGTYWSWVSGRAYHALTTVNHPISQTIPTINNGLINIVRYKLDIIQGEVLAIYKNSAGVNVENRYTDSGTYFLNTSDIDDNTSISFTRSNGINTEFYLSDVEVFAISGGAINLDHATFIHSGDNSIISNNYVSGSTSGISLARTTESTVNNNTIELCFNAIRVVDEVFNSTINSNTISHVTNYGIQVSGSDNCMLTGNHILNCNNFGVFVTNTAEKVTVLNNVITDDRNTPIMPYCISVDGAKIYNMYVSGNIFKGYVTGAFLSSGTSLRGINVDQDEVKVSRPIVYINGKKIQDTANGVLQYDSKNLQFTLSGSTGSRPSGTYILIGQSYFDTTLGIPIWWDGLVWKNATGATV